MKYIDAEKLKAEIEFLKSVLADPLCSQDNILGPDWVAGGNKMLKEISSAITSLQQEQPEVFDSVAFQIGVQEGRRLEREDVKSIIQSRIGEILGDAQPNPILRMELQELIKKIEK